MIVLWLTLAFVLGTLVSLAVTNWRKNWWHEVPDLELDLIACFYALYPKPEFARLSHIAAKELGRRREVADLQVRSN